MKTLTVRGLDEQLLQAVKTKAHSQRTSVNQWMLKMLRGAVGLDKSPLFPVHHDLDSLAGTWKAKEAAAFEAATSAFEAVDSEMWR